jgi:hypothetical protein
VKFHNLIAKERTQCKGFLGKKMALCYQIHLWRKVVWFVLYVLFCSYEIQDASDCVLGVFGKLLMRRGAWASFHEGWTCGAKVLEY